MIRPVEIYSKPGRKLLNCLKKFDGYSLIELVTVILLVVTIMPGLTGMYSTVFTNSHTAEFITVAELLAVEQVESILAHKGSSMSGFGYSTINNARYSSVNPGAPFSGFTRSVNIQVFNPGGQYEYKLITVTVDHSLISTVTLQTIIMDHSALP